MDHSSRIDLASDALSEFFGFDTFKRGQKDIIETILNGDDTVVIMPTGGGKSLCYQLPALCLQGITIVISPLIALMKDQVDGLLKKQIPSTFINSSINPREQFQRIDAMIRGDYRLVYIAPERFRSKRFVDAMQRVPVSLFAVDEAHCISAWGHDFRPAYLRLANARHALKNPQTIALTATATPEVRQDIVKYLELDHPKVFVSGFDRPNLTYRVVNVRNFDQKLQYIMNRIEQGGPGIIYCAAKKTVEKTVIDLKSNGVKPLMYHGGMSETERNNNQDQFMTKDQAIIVATNAFGMGIDRSDIRFVYHIEIPGSIEAYYQESGRAGRDGKPAECTILFSYPDIYIQKSLLKSSNPSKKIIESTFSALEKQKKSTIEMTLDELVKEVNGVKNPMVIKTVVTILDRAGVVNRPYQSTNPAEFTLINPDLSDTQNVKNVSTDSEKLYSFLKDRQVKENSEKIGIALDFLCEKLMVSRIQLKKSVRELVNKNLIIYDAPFRGKRTVLVGNRKNLDLIDWDALERKRKFEEKKLNRVIKYAYFKRCRRQFLLNYFGEVTSNYCGACDYCLGEKLKDARTPTPEQMEKILKVLSCVARMKGSYGRYKVAMVLIGQSDAAIEKSHFNEISTFGLLKNETIKYILKIIDSLIESKCISTVGKDYPCIQLSDLGIKVLKGHATLKLNFPRKSSYRKGK